MKCPHCSRDIAERLVTTEAARILGRRVTKAKQKASRENGKKGGRPAKKSPYI
jgi:hypothetical protein